MRLSVCVSCLVVVFIALQLVLPCEGEARRGRSYRVRSYRRGYVKSRLFRPKPAYFSRLAKHHIQFIKFALKKKLRHGTCKNENQCPGRQCCTRNITPNEDGGVTFDAVGSCMKVSDIENLQVTRIEDDLVGDDVANTLSTVAFGQDILGICRPGLLSAPERKRRQAQAQVTADSLVQLVTGPDVFVATEVEITEPPTTEEPITTTSEAITTTVEVVTTTPEPVTTTVAEVTTTTGPVTTTDEVVTTTPEPVTTTVAEVTTTTGPVTTTDEVVTTTPEPITTTVAEVTTTTGPITTTDEVVTTTPEPITTTAVEPATTTGPVLERRGPELTHFEHQARAAEGLLKDLITELEILDG